jgi:hypothetical protein
MFNILDIKDSCFFLIEVVKLLSERGELGKEDIVTPQGIKVPI